MTLFFTSDTHFGHGGALGLFKRPFDSVVEMNRAMVEGWNETVGPEDEVWHLGDFAIGPKGAALAELFRSLNGRKHLVAGNNDSPEARALPGWASVSPYAEMEIGGRLLVMCHFPFRSWNRMAKGAIDLHGHSHGTMKPLLRQVDVGVDAWNFRPASLDEVLERAAARRRA